MTDCLQAAVLVVQVLGLFGLFWYVIETRQMREAAQQQVEASQELIRAATAQVEGMSKPCLTLWAELRNSADAALERYNVAGTVIAASDDGNFVVQNIGNGNALNVRYEFTNPDDSANREPEIFYIPWVRADGRATLVHKQNKYQDKHAVRFDYESIGGRRYRTTIQLNKQVITSFLFDETKS